MEIKNNIAIIPCAGKNSRMNSDVPKSLQIINNTTILENILSNLINFFDTFYIPISYENYENKIFHKTISKKFLNKIIFVKSKCGAGDGQAVLDALHIVNKNDYNNNYIFLCWGDIFINDKNIINFCIKNIPNNINSIMFFPTRMIPNPYICFKRDKKNVIKKTLFSKRGDNIESMETDFSMFFMHSKKIFEKLKFYKKTINSDEFVFLDIIYWLYKKNIYVNGINYNSNYENDKVVMSFNTNKELDMLREKVNDK
tara:strand:+ start:245 stop:1012 length:768 start_codon:yes stop_codon:yes gene_type:complete